MPGNSPSDDKSRMFVALPLPEGWKSVPTPPSLFRRFQLSPTATPVHSSSGSPGCRPTPVCIRISGFGTTHVNVTVYGPNGAAPGDAEVEFARGVAALAFPG